MSKNEVVIRIRHDITAHGIVLYLKGSAAFPQCGFSAAMVQILDHFGLPYKDIDVLLDNNLREGLKDFSGFPMTPQLYIHGKFVGGCDAVREMYENGSLENLLRQEKLIA
jgi:monothiol glutaredoxin